MAAATEVEPEHYLLERYRAEGNGSAALRAYYTLRPLMPRGLQIAMRRVYSLRQARRTFPRWPVEPLLVDRMHAELRERLEAEGADRLPVVNFWPDGHRFAFILTHDVESEAGVANIPAVRAVEERHGFVSSWNFCAEEYPIREGVFDELRAAGCEIGLHGIDHKGKLFASRERWEEALPHIHAYMREWGAVGFRAPALHRNADWMPELGCLYDSSFPDTDPFAPQPGGCCSVLPFFNRDLVELPVTMVQDHDLWVILRRPGIDLWRSKATWLRDVRGLVNVIVHPDYLLSEGRLDAYGEYLEFLSGLEGGWHALPREVAEWWRVRSRLTIEHEPGGEARIVGEGAERASLLWARLEDDRLVLE